MGIREGREWGLGKGVGTREGREWGLGRERNGD